MTKTNLKDAHDDDRDGLTVDTESPCEANWSSESQHSKNTQREDAKCNIIIKNRSRRRNLMIKRFTQLSKLLALVYFLFNDQSLIVLYSSTVFKEGDMFLVLDKAKGRNIPRTKDKPRYKGPFQVLSITDSHLVTTMNGNFVEIQSTYRRSIVTVKQIYAIKISTFVDYTRF